MIRAIGFGGVAAILAFLSYLVASPPLWYGVLASAAICFSAMGIEKLTRKSAPVV